MYRIGCTHRPLQQFCQPFEYISHRESPTRDRPYTAVDLSKSPDTRSYTRPHIDSPPQATRATSSLIGSSVQWRQGSGCQFSSRRSHHRRGKACSPAPPQDLLIPTERHVLIRSTTSRYHTTPERSRCDRLPCKHANITDEPHTWTSGQGQHYRTAIQARPPTQTTGWSARSLLCDLAAALHLWRHV